MARNGAQRALPPRRRQLERAALRVSTGVVPRMGLIRPIVAICQGRGGVRPGTARGGRHARHRNPACARSGGRPMAKTRAQRAAQSPRNRTAVTRVKARSVFHGAHVRSIFGLGIGHFWGSCPNQNIFTLYRRLPRCSGTRSGRQILGPRV